jgi:hypothetical protein
MGEINKGEGTDRTPVFSGISPESFKKSQEIQQK